MSPAAVPLCPTALLQPYHLLPLPSHTHSLVLSPLGLLPVGSPCCSLPSSATPPHLPPPPVLLQRPPLYLLVVAIPCCYMCLFLLCSAFLPATCLYLPHSLPDSFSLPLPAYLYMCATPPVSSLDPILSLHTRYIPTGFGCCYVYFLGFTCLAHPFTMPAVLDYYLVLHAL